MYENITDGFIIAAKWPRAADDCSAPPFVSQLLFIN